MASFFFSTPFVLSMLSVLSTEAHGTVSFFLGFFSTVPVLVGFLRLTGFLVFAVVLLDFCVVVASAHSFPFVPFFRATNTFH
jgi:hypothetical protein